jgi:16S rRNA (guanine1516-N2)-methyltransferase
MTTLLSISYDSEETKPAALAFSEQHQYPCINISDVTTPLSLNFKNEYVELIDNEKNIAIHVDFISGDLAHRQKYGGGRGQSIAKAIGLKQGTPPPTVLDATAGLAKDAYVLACLGCSMTLLERSPVIAELTKNAIQRATDDEHFKTILEVGFNVINQSSIEYLTKLSNELNVALPDVVYLDPMYPDKKKSGEKTERGRTFIRSKTDLCGRKQKDTL